MENLYASLWILLLSDFHLSTVNYPLLITQLYFPVTAILPRQAMTLKELCVISLHTCICVPKSYNVKILKTI